MKNSNPKRVWQQILLVTLLILFFQKVSAQSYSYWSLTPEPGTFTDIEVVGTDPLDVKPIYLSTSTGVIRKSINGGETFSNTQSTGLGKVVSIQFRTASAGWALGGSSSLVNVVLRTTNGGDSWSSVTVGSTNLHALYFVSSTVGWVVGDNGVVYKSIDGGVTWTQQDAGTSMDLYAVIASSTSIAMVAGERSVVLKTSNGGANWSVKYGGNVGSPTLYKATRNTTSTYFVGAAGTILRTFNDGENWLGWTNGLSGTTVTLYGIYAGGGNKAYACGDNGTILRYGFNGDNWESMPSGRTGRFVSIEGNFNFDGEQFGTAWVVGDGMMYMRDFTSSPTCQAPGISSQPQSVTVCVGQSFTLSASLTGTVSTIVWKRNGIGQFSTSKPTLTINNASASQAGNWEVVVTSPCGSITSNSVTVTVNPPQVPSAIVGTNTPFVNAATSFSVSPIAGATFSWSAGSGGTVTGSGSDVQITWTTLGTKTISVTATDACGISTAQTKSITVSPCSQPAQPTFNPAAIATACVGQTSNFTVNPATGVSYAWSVSGGGTISGSGNSANVNWTSAGSHTVTVIPSNGCGNGTARMATVVVSATPVQPSAITGNVTVCTGVVTPYSVTNVAGVTYTWSTGGGGTISGSGNAINVTWTSGGAKTLTVTPSTSCGTGTVRALAVTVNAVPSQPSVIAGSTSVTTGISNQYSITNEAGITYAWSAGAGGTVTGTGNSVSISWSSAGGKTVTVTPSNGCGNGTARTLNVTANDCAVPTQPSTITGSATACTTGSGIYSVTSVGGVTYAWNAGTDGFVTGSGNSVTLSWTSAGTKTVTVTPSNACGNGTARTLSVTVNQLPAQPAVITGNIAPCRDASLPYSVTNVAGVTYAWDIIGTGTITGSGNSINVTWTATGSHTLRVTPSTACGAGVPRTLAVNVNDVPLAASQMAGLTSVCSGNSIPYSVGNLAGVNYTWSAGSGSTITGSTSAVSISWSTGGTKTVSVTPSNACGNGVASTKVVEVSTVPAQPSTIVGSTAAVGGIAQSYSVTNTPGVTYAWSTNADGVIASSGNTAQATWATAGAKTLTVTPSNLCGLGSARTLAVTTTVPCTIPGMPSSMTIGLGASANIALNDFRRFVVGASSGATSLNISVSPSAGTTITPVFGNTWDIVFTIPGTYTVSGVGEISGCGAGAPANITVDVCTGTVAAPTAITGQLTDVCRGTTTRYSVTPMSGVVFDWSLSSFSGTITYLNADRSTVDIAWSTATVGADNIMVKARNACNVQSSNFAETVFFKGKPTAGGVSLISNGMGFCVGLGGLIKTIGLPEAGTTYTWELNGAGTIAPDNLSVTIPADGVSRTINLYGSNVCYTNELISPLDYNGGTPIPVTPSPVSGPSTINFNVDGTYLVDTPPPTDNLFWDAGSDATITPGATSNIKNIQWSTGGTKTIYVQATNSCGTPPSRVYTVFVNGPCVAPSVPGAISGSTTVCAGVEYQYNVPFQGFDTFNWSAGADATITGTGSIRTIRWSTGGAKTISVTATNLCTTSTAQTLGVTVNTIPSQPATLIGSTSGCNGATQQFSLASPVGGVTYTWEVQGGTVVTSGAQGQIADVTWTALGVNEVKLKPSNACGNGVARTLNVTIGSVPSQPSLLSGDGEVCTAIAKTYSVVNEPGVTYAWNAGSGGTVTGSGNSVSISWSTSGSKTITVTPSNACGNGTVRTLAVNVNGVPAQPAAISGVANPILGNVEDYSVSSVAGVAYTWSLSDKGVLTGSGNSSSVVWNATGTASLTVTPSNACGNGTARAASITIGKIAQSITFTLATPVLANQTISLNGTSSSGLPIAYTSSNTAVGEIFGTELVLKASGTINITASQAGDNIYSSATNVVRSLTINKANQLITFAALGSKIFGDGDFELEASSDSGLPVSYVSSNTAVATISGNVIIIAGAGTSNITASQGGDARYNSATPVVRALTVNKADQTITFDPLVAKGISDPPFSLTGTASSGLTVTYTSSNTAVATVSGSTVTLVGQGTTTITAVQSGNTNYNAAVSVGQSLTVNAKQSQTISFAALPSKTLNDAAFGLSATASSGLAVSYTSSNTAVATISGSTVTIVGAGATTITAAQAGDGTFNAAPSVQQTLNVNKLDQTIFFTALGSKQLSGGTITLAATATSGLAVTYTSSNPTVATVSGATLTLLSAGNTTITATQSGNDNYNAATNINNELVVSDKQAQTITFAALASKTFGDAAFTLNATASSGLAVSYTSSNSAVATISGNTVTLVGAGSVTIHANQAGSATFSAATQVSQSFCVNPAKPVIAATGLNTNSPVLKSSSAAGNQWFKNTELLPGATNEVLSVTGPGVYKVRVSAGSCISAFSDDFAVIVTGDLSTQAHVSIYPNPATHLLQVSLPEDGQVREVSVFNLQGQRLEAHQVQSTSVQVDVQPYAPGPYLLQVSTGRQQQVIRFIKK